MPQTTMKWVLICLFSNFRVVFSEAYVMGLFVLTTPDQCEYTEVIFDTEVFLIYSPVSITDVHFLL